MVEGFFKPGSDKTRGSALATVVVVAGVLLLLAAVTFIYFRMNASASIFRMNRIKASTAAEAGVALALHHLSSLDSLPESGEPYQMLFDSETSGWLDIDNTGKVMVVIDPVNSSRGEWSNGAVEIRANGVAGDVEILLSVRAAPAYPSSFALVTDDGIPQGFFTDGRIVNGPVHSNGAIHFSSFTADSTDDPYVEMISTTSGGFVFPGSGSGTLPHPPGSSIWVQPYLSHMQGSPSWEPFSNEISFQRTAACFSELASGAFGEGTEIISAERLLIDGNRIVYRENRTSSDVTVSLEGLYLIVIRNGYTPVTIKGTSIPDHPLTVVSTGDMEIGGSIDGGAVGSGGPLGLVSMRDITIAADPDLTGGADWPGRWAIETDCSLNLRACVAAPNGSFKAEIPYLPRELGRVTVSGSLMENSMGRLSSGSSGYELGISWDRGLISVHPPFFPLVGRWNVYSWTPEADLPEDADITLDLV